MAQDNGVPQLPRRVPGAERRPGRGPLARPALSASDLDRIRAALDRAENKELTQADADVLPAHPASGAEGVTDEISTPPHTSAQPEPATATQPDTANAMPAEAKLVPTQRSLAEQWPDQRDEETASPPGKQAASPESAPRENGQASPEQVAPRQGNGRGGLGKTRPRAARAPARPPKPAPSKAPAAPPVPSRPRGRSRPGRAVTGGAIVMLFLLSAGSAFLLTRHAGMTTARPSADSRVAIRDRAAAWVASQVSRRGLVSCDRVMCRALKARGVPAADLLVLRLGAADPLRSSVIVVTAAVTKMVSSRHLAEDAPATLASFGSGGQRISIRMIFALGAAAYASALRDGLAARKANESWLLNPRITMSAAARRQLAAGQVDSRVVLTIANLGSDKPVYIITFGHRAPGASPGIPLRCADVVVTGSRAGADVVGQARRMSVYVHSLENFYLGARIQAVRLTGGRDVVQVGFTAPSPLGWVSTSAP